MLDLAHPFRLQEAGQPLQPGKPLIQFQHGRADTPAGLERKVPPVSRLANEHCFNHRSGC